MKKQVIDHPALIRALKTAYSAERAAAFAYVGHAASLKDPNARLSIHTIEADEWEHRRVVREIMDAYNIPVSRFLEMKFYLIGKLISVSCLFIGKFMPYFFAGKLESGNVCEYFVMMHYFHDIGIYENDTDLYEMGIKEKEHEVYFQSVIEGEAWLPLFERLFGWGAEKTLNDVDLNAVLTIEEADRYCKENNVRN